MRFQNFRNLSFFLMSASFQLINWKQAKLQYLKFSAAINCLRVPSKICVINRLVHNISQCFDVPLFDNSTVTEDGRTFIYRYYTF